MPLATRFLSVQELNAATDNPLILLEEKGVRLSAGCPQGTCWYSPMYLIAISEVANLAERVVSIDHGSLSQRYPLPWHPRPPRTWNDGAKRRRRPGGKQGVGMASIDGFDTDAKIEITLR